MNVNKLYAITKNSDSTEGRGIEIPIAYTNNKSLAIEIVNDPRFSQYCVMGAHTPGSSTNLYQIKEEHIILVSTVNEFFEIGTKEAKERALAKLTHAEKVLLGLA